MEILLYSDKKTRKGQTIVEAMVALSIIAIVMSGVISLMINSLNLVMMSRSRTEAIALAQKGLSEGVLTIQGTCNLVPPPPNTPIPGISTTDGTPPINNKFTVIVKPVEFTTEEANRGFNANFTKLSSTVTWSDKGIPGSLSVKYEQIIRNKE